MKKIYFLLCSVSFASLYAASPQLPPELAQKDLQLIDTIEAVVANNEDIQVITKSDVDRPSLAGGMRSRDDIVFERLVFLDAKKHKINPDEAAVDRYLEMIMRENKMTKDELQNVFKAGGYSFEEGRDQFKMIQAVNTMFDFRVRSNLMVPRKDVEAYFNENPEVVAASYLLEYAFVPLAKNKTRTRQKTELEESVNTGRGIGRIEWNAPFWVQQSDIAKDKHFIFDLKADQISAPRESSDGFELYRVKEIKTQRTRTLDERYRDIVDILRQPRSEQLMKQYKQELFANASVIYL